MIKNCHSIKILIFIFSIFISFLTLNSVFANTESTDKISDLQACINFGNSEQNCSNYLTLTKEVSQIIDLSYSRDQDLLNYIDCVQTEKESLNYNYIVARNNCYSNQTRSKINPKLSCFYDLNGMAITISCKGIVPSEDYILDFGIEKDKNNNIAIEPKIQLDPNFSFTGSKFILFKKDYDISALNLPLYNKIYFAPLSIEIKSSIESLESLFKTKEVKNITLDPVSRANLDCVAINVILGDKLYQKYSIKKSGLSVLFTPEQIVTRCSDDVSYTFALNLDSYNKKRKDFFDVIDLLSNNFLYDNEFDADKMSVKLSSIIEEYKKFYVFEAELNEKTDVTLKLSLDTDLFLLQLQKATKSLSLDEKKTVLASVGTTLLKNKEDNISVRRKNKLSAIIEFFNNDKKNIKDQSILDIYSDIEYSLIKNYFDDSNVVDVTDSFGNISSSGMALENFVFEIKKPLYLEYNGSKDQILYITGSDANGLLLQLNDYNINTLLPLTLQDNQLLVNNSAIIFMDINTLEKIYRGNSNLKKITLYFDSVPMYNVEKEIYGKLLGIINVKELINTKYYATTGLVYDEKKPWWDFLIVYNS